MADAKNQALENTVKAKAAVNYFSKEGEAYSVDAPKANDHDMDSDVKLVPSRHFGSRDGAFHDFFGNSQETSDLVVDCLGMKIK